MQQASAIKIVPLHANLAAEHGIMRWCYPQSEESFVSVLTVLYE